MRARAFVAAAVGIVASTAMGCGPIETTIPSSSTVNVPGRNILGANPLVPDNVFPASVIGQALAQSISQSFDTSGYDKNHVSSLKLTKLTLTVTNPRQAGGRELQDLSCLQKLTVFLGTADAPTKVADSDDGAFTAGLLNYTMPLTGAELAPVFKANDALDMTADVQPGNPPDFETDIRFDSEVTVQISVF